MAIIHSRCRCDMQYAQTTGDKDGAKALLKDPATASRLTAAAVDAKIALSAAPNVTIALPFLDGANGLTVVLKRTRFEALCKVSCHPHPTPMARYNPNPSTILLHLSLSLRPVTYIPVTLTLSGPADPLAHALARGGHHGRDQPPGGERPSGRARGERRAQRAMALTVVVASGGLCSPFLSCPNPPLRRLVYC